MSRLEEIAKQIEQKSSPPVHLWKPSMEGEIDIHIDTLGNWFHEGGAIKRVELVRLFASILWFENDQFYLVTPAEKLSISVADVPFVVQQMEYAEGVWVGTTNTADVLIVGAEHPVELRSYQGQEVPYIKVRYDLWARVNRSIYYQWVTHALDHPQIKADDNLGGNDVVLMSGGYEIKLSS